MQLFDNNDDTTARIIDFFEATPGEHRMGRVTKHLGIEGCSGMAYEKMRDKLTEMVVTRHLVPSAAQSRAGTTTTHWSRGLPLPRVVW